MIVICPHCQTPTPLEAHTEDGAARELFALLGQTSISPALVAYLGLFKPRRQALRWSRALQLAHEAMALTEDVARLGAAMLETVESLRARRQAESWKPLANHRYLISVLENVRHAPAAMAPQSTDKPRSKAAQAADALSRIAPPEGVPIWLARAILDGLSVLWTSGLEGTPALDLVEVTAQRWIEYLAHKREWNPESRYTGAARIRSAFSEIAQGGKFPQPRDVLGIIPRG